MMFISGRFANIILLACFALISCNQEKYKGYTSLKDGIYFRLHSFGEVKETPEKGDHLQLRLKCFHGDSLLAESVYPGDDGFDTLSVKDPNYDRLSAAITMMSEGDSASFIFEGSSIFTEADSLIPDDIKIVPLRIEAKLVSIKKEKIVRKERLLHSLWLKEKRAEEIKMIDLFLQENNISIQPDPDHFCFIETLPGEGEFPKSGQPVVINYKASFISGKEFYSTFADNEMFEFIFGAPGQLLPGMERGISKMREGGKARFIVPSHLAFGEKGSSTGLVGPFKSLIFDVELVKLK